MSIIIAADEIKKTLPGYTPERSEEFHEQSARLADKAYQNAIKQSVCTSVILLSGGAASGKSEYVSEYLHNSDSIIYDGTLPTLNGANIKIRYAQKFGKNPEIHAVLPKNIKIAFLVFLSRERKYSIEHFYRTHIQARNTLLELAKSQSSITIKIIYSEYIEMKESGAMEFQELQYETRQQLIDHLEQIQYTEDIISSQLSS